MQDWRSGKMWRKVSVDVLISDVVSSKMTAIWPVRFSVSEIPICKLLQESKGYCLEQPGKRDVKLTHGMLANDLKVC